MASSCLSGFLNMSWSDVFRFLNISQMRERRSECASSRPGSPWAWVRAACRLPWPLTARVPIVSGALILAVAIGVSHVMMEMMASEQEAGVRQIAAVYLDGISTTIYPHVVAHNLADTKKSLYRTMWFHQGMQEQRAIVRLPDGSLFADVSGPGGARRTQDPFTTRRSTSVSSRGTGSYSTRRPGQGGRRAASCGMAGTSRTSMSRWSSAPCSKSDWC